MTSISYIPRGSIPGIFKIPFEMGIANYDPPPPLEFHDIVSLREKNSFRFANVLSASIEVENGRVVSGSYEGKRLMNSTQVHTAVTQSDTEPIEFPVLQREVELKEESARFIQTVGGHAGVPSPRFIKEFPFVAVTSPVVWTTLALTIYADGTSERELVDASAFPHHWIYDEHNTLVGKVGAESFKKWWRQSFGSHTPWKNNVDDTVIEHVEIETEATHNHIEISEELQWAMEGIAKEKQKAVLIYDGDCGFCSRCVTFLQKRLKVSAQDSLDIRSWQSIESLSRYSLTEKDVHERAYFVKSDGKIVGGAQAVSAAGLYMKHPWDLFARGAQLPVLSFLAEGLYRIVARNRHRLPGGTNACRIEKI